LCKGKKIFRARLIESIDELPKHTQLVVYLSIDDVSLQTPPVEQLLNNETWKESPIWGFDAEGSDAPPNDKTPNGRINPVGMSYLYTSEDPHTAIVEVRPTIEQMVSVAEVEIKKDLKIFDFCINPTDGDIADGQRGIFEEIARHLSMPNHMGGSGYYATQYISQYIKKLRGSFDGIRFRSSLHKCGVNIVLFDTTKDEETKEPRNYVIKNSSVHYVDNITISESKVLPTDDDDSTE